MDELEQLIVGGRQSADEILRNIFLIDLRKALDPNNDADFLTISEKLANALNGVAKAEEGKALKAAIATLDVDWTTLDAQGRDRIITAARASFAPVPDLVVPKMELTLTATGKRVMEGTRQSITRQLDLKIDSSFSEPERVAVYWISGQQSLFIRSEYGRRLVGASEQARQIVADGLEQGLGSAQIVEDLAAKLTAVTVNRSLPYLRVVADSFIGRARTFSNLHGLDDAGITKYEFMAVLDEVTTDICRFMNGRVFYVKDAKRLYDRASKLTDPEKIKDTMPWVRTGSEDEGERRFLYFQDSDGNRTEIADISRSGVGTADDEGEYENDVGEKDLTDYGLICPPLHGRCRSSLLPA